MRIDVVVIGAGVGGSCAALALGLRGFSVALLEAGQVGRPKVCGEFLSPESRGTFARLGVLNDILAAGAPEIATARVATTRRTVRAIAFSSSGLALSRGQLDAILWRACQNCGVRTQSKTRVQRVRRDEDLFQIQTSNGEFLARFLVDASGRGSQLKTDESRAQNLPLPPKSRPKRHRFMGLKTHLRGAVVAPGEVAMFPLRGGYCGLVGIENGLTNACALLHYSQVGGRAPDELWEDFRAQNAALARATQDCVPQFAWLATGNVGFGRFAPVQNEMLRVGDAAGYIHPLTGDGMAMAARSGELAAQILGENSVFEEAAPRYSEIWHREFDPRLRAAARLQPLFTAPLFTTPALALFDRFPALATRALAQTRGVLSG